MKQIVTMTCRLFGSATQPGQTSALLARPLAHELLWLGVCAVIAARLLVAGRRDLALGLYLPAGILYAALVVYGCVAAGRPASAPWQRLRLLYPFALMLLLYEATRVVVPALGQPLWDARLAAADRWLLGGDLQLALDRRLGWIYAAPLAEIFSLAYLLLYCYLVIGVLRALRGPLHRHAAFSVGLWSAYAVGLLGYTLFPARGPYVAFAQLYLHPIDGWLFTWLCGTLVAVGAPGYDVFPSLHVGVTAVLLGWDWRTSRRWFRAWAAPVAVLWASTIYLRYHYVVDVLAGAALAAACLALAFRALRSDRGQAAAY